MRSLIIYLFILSGLLVPLLASSFTVVYVASESGTVSVYTINQTTGALTAGTAVTKGSGPNLVNACTAATELQLPA